MYASTPCGPWLTTDTEISRRLVYPLKASSCTYSYMSRDILVRPPCARRTSLPADTPASDLFWTAFDPDLIYNTVMKIVFIASSAYTIYLMLNDYKPTHDPNVDTFRVQYLLGASLALGVLFPYKYTPTEMLWAFSIWLESVAVLPQLFMLQRTGEAETITTHYLFALGAYRALYIPNWIYRYFAETPRYFDPIAVVAGIIQTVLYSDFFYIYYTKSVCSSRLDAHPLTLCAEYYKGRSSVCLYESIQYHCQTFVAF